MDPVDDIWGNPNLNQTSTHVETNIEETNNDTNGDNVTNANGNTDAKLAVQTQPVYKIYLGNLPNNIYDEDIQEIFGRFGKILEVEIRTGFGFVEYSSPEECDVAVERMHGTELRGNVLKVERAQSRTTKVTMTSASSCYNCGLDGHWARECPNLKPRPARRTSPRFSHFSSGGARRRSRSRSPGYSRPRYRGAASPPYSNHFRDYPPHSRPPMPPGGLPPPPPHYYYQGRNRVSPPPSASHEFNRYPRPPPPPPPPASSRDYAPRNYARDPPYYSYSSARNPPPPMASPGGPHSHSRGPGAHYVNGPAPSRSHPPLGPPGHYPPPPPYQHHPSPGYNTDPYYARYSRDSGISQPSPTTTYGHGSPPRAQARSFENYDRRPLPGDQRQYRDEYSPRDYYGANRDPYVRQAPPPTPGSRYTMEGRYPPDHAYYRSQPDQWRNRPKERHNDFSALSNPSLRNDGRRREGERQVTSDKKEYIHGASGGTSGTL